MKHLKKFFEYNFVYYNPKAKIDNKRQEVRQAYAKYGVGSKEYETLFDELHEFRLP